MIVYNDNENSLSDCLNYVESFELFINGKIEEIDNTSPKFLILNDNIKNLFDNSRLMPAFSVSLHNETLNELKNGSWLQINFNKEINKNGLLFNSLLFELEETQGFNLIRLYDNKYEGRCLHLNLDETFDLKILLKKD